MVKKHWIYPKNFPLSQVLPILTIPLVLYLTFRVTYKKGIGYQALNLKTFQKIKDKITLSEMHQANKLALLQGFEYQQALEYYQKSLKVAQEIGEAQKIANPLSHIGGVYQSLGYYETALENYQKASDIFQELADSSQISLTLNNIGKTYELQKSADKALKYYLSAYKIAEQFQDSSRLALISLNLAQHFKKSGDIDLAEKEALKSLDLSQKHNHRAYIKDVSLLLSKIYCREGAISKITELPCITYTISGLLV